MERLSMCRICLAVGLRMDSIVNTPLQDTYERLTSKQLATKDCKPVTACYICYARLQNCHQLREACLQGEEMIAQMLKGNAVDTLDPQYASCSIRLGATPVIVESFGYGPVFDSATVPQEHGGVEHEIIMELNEVFRNEHKEDHIKTEPGLEDPIDVGPDLEDSIKVEPGLENSFCVEPQPEIPMDIVKHEPGDTDLNASDRTTLKRNTEFIYEYNVPVEYKEGTFNDNREEKQIEVCTEKVPRKIYKKILFTCNSCEKCFYSKYDLERHKRLHTGRKPFICTVCNVGFNQKIFLERHNRIHTGEKSYQCDVCGKSFNKKIRDIHMCKECCLADRNLIEHVRIHTRDAPHQCSVCKKRFVRKYDLRKHAIVHTSETPYQCNVCKKRFGRKDTLSHHIRIHYTVEEYPHQCNVCKKRFVRKCDLQKHTIVHTSETPYQCNVCKKRFGRKDTISQHIRIHSDEKPHQCNMCSKSFRRRYNLDSHIRLHTSDKRYQCAVCYKGFVNKGGLNKHMRLHTNDKIYRCNVCMKCFKQEIYLIRHIRRQTCNKSTEIGELKNG